MARIRTIKPSFFTSLTIAALPLTARVTFVGLWTYVDDHGRGQDDARLVKAAVWPLDDTQTTKRVEADLAALAKAGLIERYTVSDKPFLAICTWNEHQKISHPTESNYPPPPNDTRDDPEPLRNPPESLRSEGNKEGNKEQGTGNREAEAGPPAGGSPPTSFDRFWYAYPRKTGKPQAAKAWRKAIPNAHTLAVQAVLDGLDTWCQHWARDRTDQRFIPHPATWLNDHRWQDQPPPPKLAIITNPTRSATPLADAYRQAHHLGDAS